MKVCDYIVDYLQKKMITTVFGYPGGMVTYLMDSLYNSESLETIMCYHEQAAAFAACAYAFISGNVGVAFATSGPGFTNLITGICHAYFESIPVLFITGQVNTNESKGSMHIRQKGFQETDVIGMINNFTKYSNYVDNAQTLKYELDCAFYYATNGRPGPVLLDIPIDIQRTEIDHMSLCEFIPQKQETLNYDKIKSSLLSELKCAKRPVIVAGNGINSSNMRNQFLDFVNHINIPIVTSMISVDLLDKEYHNNYGFIGAYGNRHSNFILSQCDLLISIGSRLDIRQTGTNLREFAKDARLIRIDVDKNEFENKIKSDEVTLYADLRDLLKLLATDEDFIIKDKFDNWIRQCDFYCEKLNKIDMSIPNQITHKISKLIPDNSVITTDVGQNQVWVAQSFHIKPHQRVLFSGGHGAMGFSLPAAIGAYYALKKPVFCINGDGGFQMNLQELQTIIRERLPIKIFILNNNSLGMIRHFQEMYFDNNYAYTVKGNGYSVPDFIKIAKAYGINAYEINDVLNLNDYADKLQDLNPVLFNLNVGNITHVLPKLAFNKPIYDQDPPIDRELLDILINYQIDIE